MVLMTIDDFATWKAARNVALTTLDKEWARQSLAHLDIPAIPAEQWQKLRYGLEGTFTREALSDADYSALSQRYAESLAESMRQARWFINPKSFRPELEIEPYG